MPFMLAISYYTGHIIDLGLDHGNDVLLLITLAVSVVAFASGHSNILQDVVHVMLFAAFLMLLFQV